MPSSVTGATAQLELELMRDVDVHTGGCWDALMGALGATVRSLSVVLGRLW